MRTEFCAACGQCVYSTHTQLRYALCEHNHIHVHVKCGELLQQSWKFNHDDNMISFTCTTVNNITDYYLQFLIPGLQKQTLKLVEQDLKG